MNGKLASEQEEREIEALFEQGRTAVQRCMNGGSDWLVWNAVYQKWEPIEAAEKNNEQQLWERLHGIDLQYADAQRASKRKDRILLAFWWLAAIAIVAVVTWKG